ncbi:MAG: peptide chain release factor 2 [Patescibacteria group bacterium]|nr:peptide chain release factor 2 [Patescibacteria group bacterium]
MPEKQEKVRQLEIKTQEQDFWDYKEEAIKISQEMGDIKQEIKEIVKLKKDLKELKEIAELENESAEDDEKLKKEIQKKILDLSLRIEKQEIKIFLSEKYDKGNAVLSVYSGAGGQDAQDWATMLLRMYRKYCEEKGFAIKILRQSFGEPGGPDGRIGTKIATIEIKGKFAYGFLKKETGVHRLVRISPFSLQELRHTSFVLVEVLPEILDTKDIEINSDDLKIDIYKSSGPGGQNVNKRETAVRITHIPTHIVVACQSERAQGLNREKAMKLLYSKLYQLKQKQEEKKMKDIKGEKILAEWGNQIRTYVLHPYKMVKDLRTNYETSSVESVLDGELDLFIQAEILMP